MLETRPRPVPQLAIPEALGQALGIIVTDGRGLVLSFSSNLEELGLDASRERLGRHWTELFPSYRRVPTPGEHDEEFVVMIEHSRRAFRIQRRPLVGNGQGTGGSFLVLRPFEERGRDSGEINHLALLNELAAGVAHEINNPLTTISGWMQMFVADTGQDDPAREQFASIQEELDRIARIVDKLLVFAQRPNSKVEMLDVNELIRNVVSFLEYQMRNADAAVETKLSPTVPAIEGRAGELKQVFLNLAINARQAMPSGGKLRVSTWVSTDGSWVEVRFRDTGHGIAEEVIDRLFEPHVTTRSAEGGSGLGLSVSREIIGNMGGTLEVESTSPSGTVFLLRLPVGTTT